MPTSACVDLEWLRMIQQPLKTSHSVRKDHFLDLVMTMINSDLVGEKCILKKVMSSCAFHLSKRFVF